MRGTAEAKFEACHDAMAWRHVTGIVKALRHFCVPKLFNTWIPWKQNASEEKRNTSEQSAVLKSLPESRCLTVSITFVKCSTTVLPVLCRFKAPMCTAKSPEALVFCTCLWKFIRLQHLHLKKSSSLGFYQCFSLFIWCLSLTSYALHLSISKLHLDHQYLSSNYIAQVQWQKHLQVAAHLILWQLACFLEAVGAPVTALNDTK